jgi:hypothetical protein
MYHIYFVFLLFSRPPTKYFRIIYKSICISFIVRKLQCCPQVAFAHVREVQDSADTKESLDDNPKSGEDSKINVDLPCSGAEDNMEDKDVADERGGPLHNGFPPLIDIERHMQCHPSRVPSAALVTPSTISPTRGGIERTSLIPELQNTTGIDPAEQQGNSLCSAIFYVYASKCVSVPASLQFAASPAITAHAGICYIL